MHAGLAFVIGVLVTVSAFLFYAAISGAVYYGLAVSVELTLAAVLIVVALIIVVIFYVGFKAQFKRIKTGEEALIGSKGLATTDLNPKGEIRVNGEFWQATTQGGDIPLGQPVEVVGMEGMFLVVKPAEQKA